jgi:urease accessory protein
VNFDIESIAPECDNTPHDSDTRWKARLLLRCRDIDGKSILTERSHVGPLRLLKPLYPEGDTVCNAVVVHPPGGIVAGDELDIDITVDSGAHLLVTTPGAQKWYRSLGPSARANTVIRVDAASSLEWIPQETIIFDRAQVLQTLSIHINNAARFFGWEILCLGRTTRNERFTQGSFRQHIQITRDDTPIWCENTLLRGDDPLLTSPLGLGGMPVIATAWIVYPPKLSDAEAALVATVRAALAEGATSAASNPVAGLIAIKVVGDSTETVRHFLTQVWSRIREDVFSVRPQTPRIWST